jgi:hypothetical protein
MMVCVQCRMDRVHKLTFLGEKGLFLFVLGRFFLSPPPWAWHSSVAGASSESDRHSSSIPSTAFN